MHYQNFQIKVLAIILCICSRCLLRSESIVAGNGHCLILSVESTTEEHNSREQCPHAQSFIGGNSFSDINGFSFKSHCFDFS